MFIIPTHMVQLKQTNLHSIIVLLSFLHNLLIFKLKVGIVFCRKTLCYMKSLKDKEKISATAISLLSTNNSYDFS